MKIQTDDKTAKHLEKLGITDEASLLRHFPARYEDLGNLKPIAETSPGEQATIVGTVRSFTSKRSWKRRLLISEAVVEDTTGYVRVIFFGQRFLEKTFAEGRRVRLSGTLEKKNGEKTLVSPSFESAERVPTHTGRIIGIYPETYGITSKWLRWQIREALQKRRVKEFLPQDILERYHLPELAKALRDIHFPKTPDHAEVAKKRFAFEEMFLLQLRFLRANREWQTVSAPTLPKPKSSKKLAGILPFSLTPDQEKAVDSILADLANGRPMNRLLNGDVGSGKTAVALLAALHTAQKDFQTAILAPTEVLAFQHFQTAASLLENSDVSVALFTRSYRTIFHAAAGEMQDVKRDGMLRAIKDGTVSIIIGTHAILQEDIRFHNLALAIVDEQHRFGVRQRASLLQEALTYTDCTQTHTDETNKTSNKKLLYQELTYQLRGLLFDIKKELGLGHKEVIYQKALEEELKKNRIPFEKEKVIPIKYNGKKLGTYRPDFIIENKIIIELKALPSIGKFERKQVWHYLKGSSYQLALLINFGREDIEIKRFIRTSNYPKTQECPHQSASGPHESVLVPHLLTMTATPIPRTLSLAFFGNLDISVLETMPRGRKRIETKIIPPEKREAMYEFVRSEIARGRQAYIILPLVEESDAFEGTKAAVAEHKRLQEAIFPDLSLGLVHGKMKAKDKEAAMRDFRGGKTNILVATAVVEVGVDVPNATIMLIEEAQRFGLSQLHQFRGRIGRGEHQSHCFLLAGDDAERPTKRMRILETNASGFDIAQEDLKLRGPGEFLGARQSGLPDIGMENLMNMKLITFAREEAQTILDADPDLENHPELAEKLEQFDKNVHLE